jgi:hypothetical protein
MLSSVNTVQPAVQRCFRFERGRYNRGRGCKFLHSREANSGLTENENVGLSSQSASPEASGKKPGNQGRAVKICRHFVQRGWCAFGDSCVFLHSDVLPADKQNVSVKASADLELCDELPIANNEAEAKYQFNRAQRGFRPKICRFYKAGYCRYGKKCKNRHAYTVSETCGARQRRDDDDDNLNENSSNDTVHLDHREEGAGAVPKDVQGRPGTNISPGQLQVSPEEELCQMRKMEIQQLRRRYPKAQEVNRNGQTVFKFVFQPTDPDWVNTVYGRAV